MRFFKQIALRKKARTAIDALSVPENFFDYSIAWSKSYSDLFASASSAVGGIDSLRRAAQETGRVLVCGRAGSGKSVVARHIARDASRAGVIVIFLDMSRWETGDAKVVQAASSEPISCINYLVSKFSGLDASLLDFDALSPGIPKLFIVDGLNEMPSGLGAIVLSAFDATVTRLVGCQVLVTDRLVRRSAPESRWRFARLEPLSDRSVEKALRRSRRTRPGGAHSQLLDWPFFLARFLEGGLSGTNGTDALKQFFSEHAKLSPADLEALESTAYRAYEQEASRTFPKEWFVDRIGQVLFQKLESASAVRVVGEFVYFAHHLQHDFLAASFVAKNPAIWGYESFNNLTFQGSSFDSIALAFAQSADRSRFVREVYDWNFYAIAFALSEPEYRQPDDLDGALELVVMSMLAEKRWDAIVPTAMRAQDALALFPHERAIPFLQAGSLGELLDYVRGLPTTAAWFEHWQALFSSPPGAELTNETVDRLSELDSIVGWTVANVLKRMSVSDAQIERVVNLARSEREVVRWRAVHVLGAFPTDASLDAALRLLGDSDPWVRYGAIRSVVEMASRTAGPVRGRAVEGIIRHRAQINESAKLRGELARAAQVRPQVAVQGWLGIALSMLSCFLEHSSTVEELDFWSNAIRELRALYPQG